VGGRNEQRARTFGFCALLQLRKSPRISLVRFAGSIPRALDPAPSIPSSLIRGGPPRTLCGAIHSPPSGRDHAPHEPPKKTGKPGAASRGGARRSRGGPLRDPSPHRPRQSCPAAGSLPRRFAASNQGAASFPARHRPPRASSPMTHTKTAGPVAPPRQAGSTPLSSAARRGLRQAPCPVDRFRARNPVSATQWRQARADTQRWLEDRTIAPNRGVPGFGHEASRPGTRRSPLAPSASSSRAGPRPSVRPCAGSRKTTDRDRPPSARA
jgi:hypothetical protein